MNAITITITAENETLDLTVDCGVDFEIDGQCDLQAVIKAAREAAIAEMKKQAQVTDCTLFN